MSEEKRLPASVLDSYPPADRALIHAMYERELQDFHRKLVVLDDDPTGVQTVHDVPVYTDWEEESLREALAGDERMFFILTNSRSFTAEETETAHRELAERVLAASRSLSPDGGAAGMAGTADSPGFLLISRGDSTLRGHYPLELEVLKEVLEENTGKRIDGQILCPYFREGGRFTIDSVHYVREGEWLVPAGQTEFAEDRTFGFSSSHLGEYAEEKSGGRYLKKDGIYITLDLLRGGRTEEITEMLMGACDFRPVVVDAIEESDVELFAVCLLRAIKAGREFLLRTAAAVPKVLGNVPDRPLLGRKELTGGDGEDDSYGGIVLIGSHVKKTTAQLEALKKTTAAVEFLEFNVNAFFEEGGLASETERMIEKAEKAMALGRTAVVYTSRALLAPRGASREELLKLSVGISDAVTAVIAGLHRKPRFLIAKGGITSSDVGTKALRVRRALVLGQAQPGVPVWRTGPESRFPGLSYIIFPGNVGDEDTLRKIVELLAEA